jgi:hypothetical protein
MLGEHMPKRAKSRTPLAPVADNVVTFETAAGLAAESYAKVVAINPDNDPTSAYYAANEGFPARVRETACFCPYCSRDFRPALSAEEGRTLDYIMEYLAENGKAPSYKEIENNALPKIEGEKHSGRTNYSLAMLEAKGYIDRGIGWRSITIVPTISLVEPVPVRPRAVINPHGWPNYFRFHVKGKKMPHARPHASDTRERVRGRFAPSSEEIVEPVN